MSRNTSGPGWSGDMLDRPEMVQAFAAQLRRVLSDQAAFVAQVRRDAEAMWKENPPEGYSSFEAWWRHSRVTSPFAEIQELLETAAKRTFRLAARYEKHRHTIPDARRAAVEAKQQQALPPAEPEQQARPPQKRRTKADQDFLEMIRQDRPA
ncbi:hypothetical protein [Nonomuraea zeae]|uniref:Uncharacterized protein n=1 Tax=Nonomuraea zeae TaxID=1642303 RepID=A0A5S4H4B2_9ACTN|nr:hypothetical protein [Nonomuraea zeae]TMR39584.1 hypothetical protein ETD85_00800 [Nonomuraea zeae]